MEDAVDALRNYEKPFFYGTPWIMFAILSAYLYFVLWLGPKIMERRQPFQFKTFMVFYNLIQVVACIYVIKEILVGSKYKVFSFWNCEILPVTPEELDRYFDLTYFLFWLKLIELTETVVFVLRKKQNQVSPLHVFHHCSTVTLIFLMINHNLNGYIACYPLLLNSVVHIFMYLYYLIAAVADDKIVRRILPLKKSITVIQMIQFTLILIQAVFIKRNCQIPDIVLGYYVVVVLAMFYGFYDFYKKSYTKNKSQKKDASLKKAATS